MSVLKEYLTNRTLAVMALVTLAVAGIYTAGIFVPGPGVDTQALAECQQAIEGYFGVLNVFGAGGLVRLSPFALGVLPFITMSIIITLGQRVLPPFRWAAETPKRKLLVTFFGGLVLLSGNALAAASRMARPGGLSQQCTQQILPPDMGSILLAAGAMVLGGLILVALSEVINRYGIGSGMSIIIALGIALGIPFELQRLGLSNGPAFALMALLLLVGLFIVVAKTDKIRKILPFRQEMEGGYMVLNYVVPFNLVGVMPIVLANVLVYAPSMAASIAPESSWAQWIQNNFSAITQPLFLITLILLTVGFTFYQVIVTYDAETTAKEMAAQDYYATEDRTMESSAKAVDDFLLKVTIQDSAFLAVLTLIPGIAALALGISTQMPLGGASLLILVAVVGGIAAHSRAVADYQMGRPLPAGVSHPRELNRSMFDTTTATTERAPDPEK